MDVDTDYPPTRTYRLGTARETVADRVDECEARVDELEDDDDATERALAEAREEAQAARTYRKGLAWAINGDGKEGFDGWGADAELTVRAHSYDSRARVLDTRDRRTAGPVGPRETRTWLIAGSITDAPWLDGDEDLVTQKQLVGQLRPMFVDWLDEQLGDLNDLTEGN